MAVPDADPVPFAPDPPAGSFWPIVTSHPRAREVNYRAADGSILGGNQARQFLSSRSGGDRHHVGIDLYASFGDSVVAIADGRIANFYGFCCGETKTTYALLVDHGDVVVNYGEVAPDSLRNSGLAIGSAISAGQVMGTIGRNPGGSSMLHFETYRPGTTANARWNRGSRRPAELLNPTSYLLWLLEHGRTGTAASGLSPPPLAPERRFESPRLQGNAILIDVLNGRRFLRRGNNGEPVRKVQQALLDLGYSLSRFGADGDFGRQTEDAVRQFQTDQQRTDPAVIVDGIVGEQTMVQLDLALLAAPPAPTGPSAPPAGRATPAAPTADWSTVEGNHRMLHVMELLTSTYHYPMNGAAGIVGNLQAESGVIPNRIEGSSAATPMRARNFDNVLTDFTAEEIMSRNPATRQGPRLAGVGLAQWTSAKRRAGLFQHSFGGRVLGASILHDMDAQVDYLVTELGAGFARVDRVLRGPAVSLNEASDEIVYNFEVPGSVLTTTRPRRKRPRTDAPVVEVFNRRRTLSQAALNVYLAIHTRGSGPEAFDYDTFDDIGENDPEIARP